MDTQATHTRPPDTQWITAEQVQARYGWSRSTLERYVRSGMPKHQPGGANGRRLFAVDEIDAWLRSRCSERVAGGAA